jgi:heavy metal sensor kinase
MIRSLRAQLTAWYLALFSVLFVLFALFLYQVLARSLRNQLDAELLSEADTAVALFQDEMAESNGDAVAASHDAMTNMRTSGSHAAVLFEGRVLSSNAPVTSAELTAILAQAVDAHGRILLLKGVGSHGEHAAVHSLRLGGRTFLLISAAPLDRIAHELATVRSALWVAMPLLVALAALGGYLLASRRLAPVGWMAEQARQISGRSLHKRLEIGNAAEELTVLAESFNELLTRLDQSFEGMKRFVADASHELRTPIAIIRGEADVALSQDRSPLEYRAALATILDESRRISRLVDDLLNLARADAGHVRLRLSNFYLNDLLAECCRSVQSLARARGIELTCAASSDLTFHGDEELLRRLVVNLLDNAIRYTPEGGKVSAALACDGGNLRLTVADTGSGIPPEAVPHVFERFFRADKARSRQDGGFGLGLAIVKWIAESHRGAVDLATAPGNGTTFTVTLPVSVGPEGANTVS